MKKYLIIEAYTDANIGSGALVENTVRLLKEQLSVKNNEIRIMAHTPAVFQAKYGVKSVKDIFNYPFNRNRFFQVYWLLRTLSWMSSSWLFPKMALKHRRWNDFAWADVVLSVGAERINDKYIKNELFSLFTYGMAKKFDKKMVLAPSTYGPFLYGFTKKTANYIFNKLDLIYCRDTRSYETVTQFKGIDKSKVINTSDVAIIQDWDEKYSALKFSNNKHIVGVSILKWTYVANKYETQYCSYDSYVYEMARFVSAIIDNYDVNVVLLPTNFPVNGCREDDVTVARDVLDKCNSKNRLRIIESLPSAKDFKSIMACSEVNVTTRMHACIFSTSAHIPTMSINYLFKLQEYMNDIQLNDYSIDIEDFNADDALKVFEKLWDNRSILRKQLHSTMSNKKAKLREDINELSKIL